MTAWTAWTAWPALESSDDTRETLHRWTQIVGKIRLSLTPHVNHYWNVPLYVTPRGLTTSDIPYADRSFDMEFDFLAHVLRIRVSDNDTCEISLRPRSVANMYAEVIYTLKSLGIECHIWPTPVEIEDPIPLDRDELHRAYDRRYAEQLRATLDRAAAVFGEFRAGFIGKCSPVHFFWGSFDLAVTRFSGRVAPPRPNADTVTREAYSHEVSSVGFWPGGPRLPHATFYSYAAPEPAGFREATVAPAAAYYNEALGGFYLHLDDLREADDPNQTLLAFCQTTYEAAATLGNWDRAALESRS